MPKPRDPAPQQTTTATRPMLRLVGVEDVDPPRDPECAATETIPARAPQVVVKARTPTPAPAPAPAPKPAPIPSPASTPTPTATPQALKPSPQSLKPTPDFPLTLHPRRGWIKKVRGKQMCFGPESDPWGALERYTAFAAGERDTLVAAACAALAPARPAPAQIAAVAEENRSSVHLRPEGMLLRDIANAYVAHQQERLDAGKLQPRSFADLMRITEILVTTFGATTPVAMLRPTHFGELRKTLEQRTKSPDKLNQLLVRVRSVFKFAEEEGLIPRRPAYGAGFKKPPRSAQRRRRAERGPQMFSREEVRTLLAAADPVMRAMILLGINGGLGNSDLAQLRDGHLHEGGTVIRFPRPKTGIDRCIPLLPETVGALRTARALRPTARRAEWEDRVFLTRHGNPWVKTNVRSEPGSVTPLVSSNNAISANFKKLCRRCTLARLDGPESRGFYALRHTFRTVVDECPDRPAIDLVMGHENANDMSVTYREHISLARLRAVVEYVRRWMEEPHADSTVSAIVASEAPAAPDASYA